MKQRYVLLKGGFAIATVQDAFDIVRSQPYRQVAAVLGTLKTSDCKPSSPARQADRALSRSSAVFERVVPVGDRGLLAAARIREDLQGVGLRRITALRSPTVRKLVGAGEVAVVKERLLLDLPPWTHDERFHRSVRVPRPLAAWDFAVDAGSRAGPVTANVIGVIENHAATRHPPRDRDPGGARRLRAARPGAGRAAAGPGRAPPRDRQGREWLRARLGARRRLRGGHHRRPRLPPPAGNGDLRREHGAGRERTRRCRRRCGRGARGHGDRPGRAADRRF